MQCPKCGGRATQCEEADVDPTTCSVNLMCDDCGEGYEAEYTLTKLSNTETGEELDIKLLSG